MHASAEATIGTDNNYISKFDLDISECVVGEAQLERGNNLIC
jgi:hypothetical protein